MNTMPFLEAQDAQIDMINTFGGYKHKMSINDGEFYDMKNLACDDFPLAASRAKRGNLNFGIEGAEFLGICGQDKLNVVYRKDIADAEFEFARIYGTNEVTLRYNASYIPIPENKLAGKLTRVATGNDVDYVTIQSNTASYQPDPADGYKYVDIIFEEPPTHFMTEESRIAFSWSGLSYESPGGIQQYYFYIDKEDGDFKLEGDMMIGLPLRIINNGTEENITIIDNSGYAAVSGGFVVAVTLESEPQTLTAESTIFIEHYISHYMLDPYAQPGGSTHNIVGLYPSKALAADELAGKKMTVTTDDTVQDMIISHNTASAADAESPTGYADTTISFTEDPLVYFKPTSEFSMIAGKLCIADYDMALQQFSHQTIVGEVEGGEHQIVKMGAYVIIFPEKIKVNTTKVTGGQFSDIKPLEKSLDMYSSNWRMCYHDGDTLTIEYASPTPHDNPAHGEVWADTSEKPAVVRKYNENLGTWAVIAPYIEFYSTSNYGIEEYDALEVDFGTVLLSYVDPVESQKYYVVSSAGKYDGNGHIPNNYYFRFPIAFKAATPTELVQIHTTFNTTIPILDYVFECNNRLWGCRYGENAKGDFVNEIFASRLGDPGNFHYFANTSMDAYYVSLGDEGPFTGGIAYNSQPVFFRQDKVHRISGNYPANYQLKTTAGYGCQKGSYRSVVSVNNIVYYLSTVGVMAYSGDIPVSMADAFGAEMYHAGVAGTIGNKYYISMHDEGGAPVLFCYDDSKAMWHKEDNLDVKQFLTYDGECYALTEDNKLIATGGVTGAPEADFDWLMETGELGYASPFKKRILKVNLRLRMPLGTMARIDIQYDGDGNWINCADLRPTGKVNSLVVPISPFRCDYFKIRVHGKGEVKLLSVTKFYEEGSDE